MILGIAHSSDQLFLNEITQEGDRVNFRFQHTHPFAEIYGERIDDPIETGLKS
jgi:hypothetical protein